MEREVFISSREKLPYQLCFNCCTFVLPLVVHGSGVGVYKDHKNSKQISVGLGEGQQANIMGKLERRFYLNALSAVPAGGGIQPTHLSTMQICSMGMV